MMVMVHKHHVHRLHSEHSGGVVEGGDHDPLIGGEQSWRKGESGKLLTLSTTNV